MTQNGQLVTQGGQVVLQTLQSNQIQIQGQDGQVQQVK